MEQSDVEVHDVAFHGFPKDSEDIKNVIIGLTKPYMPIFSNGIDADWYDDHVVEVQSDLFNLLSYDQISMHMRIEGDEFEVILFIDGVNGEIFTGTWSLSNPTMVNGFHKTFGGFIKSHYITLADDLDEKANSYRSRIKEISDELHTKTT